MRKLSSEQEQIIVTKFSTMQRVDELAELLNVVYTFLFPSAKPARKSKIINFEAKTLNYLAFGKDKRYTEFQVPKKKVGELRTISSPIYTLKTIQRCLNVIFNCVFIPHKTAHGFAVSKSIKTNAERHVGKNYVYNIDLEGFFPNTNNKRIKTVLGLSPFNLIDQDRDLFDKNEQSNKTGRGYLAFLITNLCCENDCLPQGAPTSPTLTNVVCQRLDRKLYKLSKQNVATYTRYADDITFSSNKAIFTDKFKAEINKIIVEEGYSQNPAKERLQNNAVRQEVTGVIVNQRLNVTREYLKELDLHLKIWSKYGYADAHSKFEAQYKNEKGFLRNKGKIPPMENVLWGKIQFLGMVRGQNDAIYLRFCDIYKNKCIAQSENVVLQKSPSIDLLALQKLLNIWEQSGLDEAINFQ
jgi:RNA-directed DNA polymerase